MIRSINIILISSVIAVSVTSFAEAQIVRHIIGHAIAGKAAKSILENDKDQASDQESEKASAIPDSKQAPAGAQAAPSHSSQN